MVHLDIAALRYVGIVVIRMNATKSMDRVWPDVRKGIVEICVTRVRFETMLATTIFQFSIKLTKQFDNH